jgi:leader peptidase (prepilin peptidase) / N-methyltransferase
VASPNMPCEVILALPDWSDFLRSPVFETFSFLVGLIVGSFANVCIHRLPLGLSVVSPPSRCPHCESLVRPYDNVPLVSFLLLGGRCRECRTLIPLRYPAVEAANGFIYLALAVLFGPSLQTAVAMALSTALLVLSLIDLDHHILPDAITLPGIAAGLLASLLPGSPLGIVQAAAAALGGYLVMLGVAKGYELLRGVEGLGQGDWKMAAMLGAFLGWQKLLLTIFLASLLGTLVGLVLVAWKGGTLQKKLPLGTFLGGAAIVCLFAGDALVVWYRSFFRG